MRFSAIVADRAADHSVRPRLRLGPGPPGDIFPANLELGFMTPPIGMNLFLSSYRFGKPMGEVIAAALPMMFVLLLGVLLTTYFQPLTTFLPRLFP
jgi:TRAP-type C4-dicarboxylate transport system permease large subunit